MNIIVVENEQVGGREGYKVFEQALANGANVFGLATGSTPVTIYENIVASDLDFSEKTSINLDEYQGLAGTHEQSYRYFMDEHLFNKKPFKETFVPNGLAEDPEAEAKRYDQVIADHPIDMQILGIGQNGHIGFNEPGTSFDITTHLVDLAESTIEANARFFADKNDVPRRAYSMGIGSIMKSKQILLVAYGESKADAIAGMIEGPVTEEMPASVLQRHDNVTVLIDKAAASKLSQKFDVKA